MDINIGLKLRCDQQNEHVLDEIYLAVGIVHSNGVAHAKNVWEGGFCAEENPHFKRERTIEVWKGHLEPGNVAALIINLIEQDTSGNKAGVEFAKQLATRAGGCISQAKSLEALEALGCHDFSSIVKRATSAFGCLKGDELLGTFMIALSHPHEGGLRGKIYPIAEADGLGTGHLALYGSRSVYLAEPMVNGRSILQPQKK